MMAFKRSTVAKIMTTTVASSLLLTASALAADTEILIGGPAGEVWQGTLEQNDFTYFTCTCNGPIQDLALNDSREFLYVGDEWGQVIRFRMSDGQPDQFMFATDPVAAMVTYDNDVFAAGANGTIRRLDGTSGIIEASFVAPIEIDAMHRIDNTLYVSGPNAEVWQADLSGDMSFSYFACGCSGPVTSMTANDTHLLVGDTFGMISEYNLTNGVLENIMLVPGVGQIDALKVDGDDVVGASGGDLFRFDTQTHNLELQLDPSIEVNALLLLQPADSPFELSLSVTNLIGGQRAMFEAKLGTPGEKVAILWSKTRGSFELNNGEWCVSFGIDLPANDLSGHAVGVGVFDARGVFETSRVVPQFLSHHELLFQAAEQNSCPDTRMSDVVSGIVQ